MKDDESKFVDEASARLREALADPVADWPLSWTKIVRVRADIFALLDLLEIYRDQVARHRIKGPHEN